MQYVPENRLRVPGKHLWQSSLSEDQCYEQSNLCPATSECEKQQ